jgi:hypothetical protein
MKPALFSIMVISLLAGMLSAADELRLFPHELPWSGKQALSNEAVIEDMAIRQWMAATVFPEFKFSGTLEEAISYLMSESRKVTPGGRTIGGFVVREKEGSQTLTTAKIDLHLKGKNALEIIDALCGAAKKTWMLTPCSILIGADAEKVTGGQDRNESSPDPFAQNDGKGQPK